MPVSFDEILFLWLLGVFLVSLLVSGSPDATGPDPELVGVGRKSAPGLSSDARVKDAPGASSPPFDPSQTARRALWLIAMGVVLAVVLSSPRAELLEGFVPWTLRQERPVRVPKPVPRGEAEQWIEDRRPVPLERRKPGCIYSADGLEVVCK